MNRKNALLTAVFTLVMFVYVLFMAWYIPASASLRFQLADTEESLKTSRGRERKQQYEYDSTVEEIPQVREKLDLLLPQVEEAERQAEALKKQKKELKKEKKELEAARKNADSPDSGTESGNSPEEETP